MMVCYILSVYTTIISTESSPLAQDKGGPSKGGFLNNR